MSRYTVVYKGDPAGVKILSGEPASGEAVGVMAGDQISAGSDMLAALNLVRISAGWQYLSGETRTIIVAAIAKATA